MAFAEQLALPISLDGLPIGILGLSDATIALLQKHNLTSIEHTAHLATLYPIEVRNEIITALEYDLRERLQAHIVHCSILQADETHSRAQFIIESNLFVFTASMDMGHMAQCTCTYRWSNSDWLSCVPFHDPDMLQQQRPKTLNENRVSHTWDPSHAWGDITPRLQRQITPQNGYVSHALASRSCNGKSSPVRIRQTLASLANRPDIPSDVADLSIQKLDIPTRVVNALIRADLHTIGQVASTPVDDLLQINNFGRKALQEVRDALCRIDQCVDTAPDIAGRSGQSTTLQQRYALPADIGTRSLERLHFSTRTFNALRRAGISTLADLITLRESDILSIHNAGKRSLQEIHDTLSRIDIDQVRQEEEAALCSCDESDRALPSEAGLSLSETNGYRSSVNSLEDLAPDDLLEQFLSHLTERDYQVIILRYGLAGHQKQTLEEVGGILGCTRERVRQIEKRTLNKLQVLQHYRFIQPLIVRLEHALEQSHGILSLAAASAILYDNDVENIPTQATQIVLFVLNFAHNIKLIKGMPILLLDTPPFAPSIEHVDEVCTIFKRIVTEALAPLPVSDVLARFADDRKGKRLVEHIEQAYLIACLRAHPDILIDEQDSCSLKQWEHRRLDDMIIVLREHGKPLHYREIANRVNQRLPEDQQTTAHNIHAHIGRLPDIFVRVGHGVFGLAEWGLARDDNLADAAHRVLTEVGHALSIEELIDRVLETWRVKRTSVRAAIDLDDRFEQVGRNIYWLKNKPQTQTEEDAPSQSSFDQMFGSLLFQRQQTLERDRISAEQTNDLEEIRRLDIDLLR
jgi:RNA polymerase sigma factor (sigma-70 family)